MWIVDCRMRIVDRRKIMEFGLWIEDRVSKVCGFGSKIMEDNGSMSRYLQVLYPAAVVIE